VLKRIGISVRLAGPDDWSVTFVIGSCSFVHIHIRILVFLLVYINNSQWWLLESREGWLIHVLITYGSNQIRQIGSKETQRLKKIVKRLTFQQLRKKKRNSTSIVYLLFTSLLHTHNHIQSFNPWHPQYFP
jgi:hypothetical protein